MKKKFILLAMMLLTLMGGVKFNVLNAQIDLTKQYRLKVNEGGYAGKYLHVNSFYAPNNQPQVGIAAKAENTNQIFTLEDAGNGNYYLKCATNDYYIKCAVGSQWWCVYAYSTTEKTPLYFHYTDGTNFYLRDYDKMMGIGGTDAGLTTNNYFKVENNGVYCDASPNYNSGSTYNANTSYVTTWSLEEVVFSVVASADATEIWSDETVNLTAVAMDGAGSYTYSWSPATGLDDATSATPVFTPTAAGTYTFTCTATDANGATATSDEISILVKDVKDKPVIQDIVVGNGGSTSNYLPVDLYYGQGLTQQIYTKAQLNEFGVEAGRITKIAFYASQDDTKERNFDIYMINTSKSSFSSDADWVSMTESDKVYSGKHTYSSGMNEFVLSTPFEYDGNGSILICLDDNTGGYTTYRSFEVNSTGNKTAIYHRSDDTNYNPFNPSYQGTVLYVNNKIRFTIEVSTDPTIEVNYTSLDFGTVRAGGDFWTEKETPSFNVNVTAKNTKIKSITGNDDFFNFSDVTGAVDQTEFNFTVSYNKEAEAGEKSGNIVVTYMNGEEEATVEIPMTATAYVPAQGDVVENPIEVTFDENGDYTYTINSLDVFYDDYVFSPNEQYDADAKDMSFSFTLTEDALVHVYDTDENYVGSWCSLYGDFTVENGPQYKKDYPGEQLLSAGTYYVVISPNQLPFNLKIEKSSVPAPTISYSSPYDGEINQNNPTLEWNMQYADEYQVLFGTSEDALEEVASETATQGQTEYSFQTSELQNNTKYYWQVIATNEAGTTTGEVRSFVTLLDVPQITSPTTVNLYPGEKTTITWEAVANATSYKVYNGETVLATLEATETSYELSGLEYNMTGYNITVTATQEGLGESLKSTAVVVKVAGTFPLTVNVKDSNNKPIEGATVTINVSNAYDQFQIPVEEVEVESTNAEGKTTVTLPLLSVNFVDNETGFYKYPSYTVDVSKTPYDGGSQYIGYSGLANGTEKSIDIILYLPTPSNLYAEEYMLLAGQDLTLNWTAVEGVTGYNVYRQGAYNNSTWTYEYELLGTSTKNTYTAVAEYDGSGSKYAVSAVFEGGLESDKAFTYDYIYVLGTGDVKGLVTDTEGNPVAGAALELSGTNGFGEDIHILETESDGTFLVEEVIEGAYSLTVSHYNYEAKTVSGISVNYNIENDLGTIELTPKASIENVTVTADNNGNVSWTGDYAKWNVYRRNANAPQELTSVATEVTTTNTTDTEWETLKPGTYQYGVAALVEPQAQTRGTEVIFEEGFENNGTNVPAGWSYLYYSTSYGTYNTTSNYCWKINQGDIYYSYTPMDSYSACVNNGGNLVSNAYSYLVSSQVDLSNKQNPILSFWYMTPQYSVSYQAPSYVNTLKVKILTSEAQCSDPANNGEVEWTSNATHVDVFTASGEIDLSDYVGQIIYIVFETDMRNGRYTALDNVQVSAEGGAIETQIVWSNGVVKQGPATFIGGDTENPTAWNVDANWSTGSVPADGADVIINADAVISSEVNVASITINNGDSYPYNTLTVADKGILTVTGTISQQSDYLLVLEEGGQIFQNNANVTARFRMSIDNPSDWSDETNKDGWQFISMPMTGVDYYGFASTWNSSTAQPTCDYDLYKYDGSQEMEWQNFRDGGFEEDTFKSGTGYLASRKEVSTVSLSGTLNVETPFVFSGYNQIIYNEEKDLANFRLFGNPFTYDIYMSDFDLDLYNDGENDFVSGYAVVNNSGSYDYRTTEPIKVGEGFFVKALTTTAIAYAPASKRSENKSDNSLNITATGNAGKDNVVINLAGKSEGFNKLQNFNDAIATVYVAEDGKNYGIYNCDADVQEIELNFNANQMGNYTISIQPNGKFQTVTLVDRFTGVETNMLVEDYHFTAMSGVNNNRFIVKLAVSDQQSAVSDNFVYQSGEDLIIDAEGTVQIIDVMGRVLLSDEVESTNNRINVSGFRNGTYMVRVINGSEVKVEKVVIY